MRVGASRAFRAEIAPMASWKAWEDAMGGFATKQRDLGLCQAATAAIILSIPRMLSARRKL